MDSFESFKRGCFVYDKSLFEACFSTQGRVEVE